MLILTRKVGEEIRIGEDITIMVTGIRGEFVKIGITAPKETRIMRTEILERKGEDDEK